MKYFLTISLFLLFTNSNNAAEIDSVLTRVIYKMAKPFVEKKTNTTVSPEVQRILENRAKAYDLVECELLYNKTRSIFKIIEKLSIDDEMAYGMVAIFARGIYYKDLKNQKKIKQVEVHGETLNVFAPFEEYNWKITSETKIINGFKCYKATAVYEEFDNRKNKNNIFTPEVWFTPEIPAPFGPRGLDGLPGLVLEGKFNNHAYFYASKITFDINNADLKIEKPKKGKDITVEEYKQFMAKIYTERKSLNEN